MAAVYRLVYAWSDLRRFIFCPEGSLEKQVATLYSFLTYVDFDRSLGRHPLPLKRDRQMAAV
jgi:hypothetical protein